MALALAADRVVDRAPVALVTSPVRLVVLPIQAVNEPGDYFQCIPYSATIRAAICIERQRLARAAVSPMKQGDGIRHGARMEYHACRTCPDGAVVAGRVGYVSPTQRRGGGGKLLPTKGKQGAPTSESALEEAGKQLRNVDRFLERRWQIWMRGDRTDARTKRLVCDLAVALRVVSRLAGPSAGGARHVERCIELLLVQLAAA